MVEANHKMLKYVAVSDSYGGMNIGLGISKPGV